MMRTVIIFLDRFESENISDRDYISTVKRKTFYAD